ncbi:class I SAM-dependent methyltransferase [Alkalihalobacillus pseudalcaliphilus]|uniref:class I SAM-dependent methyltransferase n=1 Tax=Alkalihalobacillus pseudalcaliphilus TaxID=79884 RepID=UPI00064D7B98|nr:class I SAM-dependent methyltransferase [Alkalihalobacillus pseudalcaliphilus]KMK75584.1 methyltransferase [Alkalihalobacillus pseudalcaliphilus]
MSFSYYGELCTEVYDLTKKIGQSFDGDIEFYQEKLKGCRGQILEAMVGSGRVYIPLLQAGLDVDGVDYSENMLNSCRQHCDSRGLKSSLFQADLRELSLPHKYEAIIIPAGSLLLIENREDSIQVLKKLYEHLEVGGKLLLDLFIPDDLFQASQFEGASTFHSINGDIITMEEKLIKVDWLNQFKVSYLKYEKWRQGALIQTELQRFGLRWYGVEEFKLILENIGFSQVEISADFTDGKKPSNSKQAIVYEAIK